MWVWPGRSHALPDVHGVVRGPLADDEDSATRGAQGRVSSGVAETFTA